MQKTDQRRFIRVPVNRKLADLFSEFAAVVTWPNQEESVVRDISFKGLAVVKPGLFELRPNEILELNVTLGVESTFRAQVRVAWSNFEVVGLELLELPPEGHQAMGAYFEQKLRGRQLKPVERFHFAADQTFRYWFQGPGTHVFIWLDQDARIQTVRVEMDDTSIVLERGQTLSAAKPGLKNVLLILSEMDAKDVSLPEFLTTLKKDS